MFKIFPNRSNKRIEKLRMNIISIIKVWAMYYNAQEKLGVMSSFKEISIQFELFHKNFLRVSCEPRTV